jgi:hypothetical protein
MRCPSGSGWGEAPVMGRFRAAPAKRTSRTCATPDGRRRAAEAGRPLARETSAGGARCFGWASAGASALLVAFGSQGSNERRASSPGSGGLHGGWLQPHPEVFLPVQRKLGAPRRRFSDRGSVDPVVVLVDCSGCRSRRESPGPSQPPRRATAAGSVGSSHVPAPRVSYTGPAVAKGCQKPARGGKAGSTVAGYR